MKFHQFFLLSAIGKCGLATCAESNENLFTASEVDDRLSLFRTLTEEGGSLLPIVNPPTVAPFPLAPASERPVTPSPSVSTPVTPPFPTQTPSAVAGEVTTKNPAKASKKKTISPNSSPIAKVKASKSPSIAAKAKKSKSPKAKKTTIPKAKKTKSPKAKKTKSPKAKKTTVKGQKTSTPSVVGRVEVPAIAKSKAKSPGGKGSKFSSESGESTASDSTVEQASERTSALVDGSTEASSAIPSSLSRVWSVGYALLIFLVAIMV